KDVRGLLQVLRRSDSFVHARETENAIRIGLEAALRPEPLENRTRRREIARELRDPRVREHRELVEIAIAPLVFERQALALCARLFGLARDEEMKRALELEVRRRFARDLVLPEREELARAARRILHEVEDRPETHEGELVVR